MVVDISLDKFPDVEDLLMAYLGLLGLVDPENIDTVVPADGVAGIEVARIGGIDDGITDYPLVEVSCYAEDRNTVKNMSEAVRQALQNDVIRSAPVEYTDDDGFRWVVQVDRCDTDTPPENIGYKNPERRRRQAFYRLALRRPRTPPRKD